MKQNNTQERAASGAQPKHTLGPWYVGPSDFTERCIYGENRECVASAKLIQHAGHAGCWIPDESEMEANARLIAAALELLEAVKELNGIAHAEGREL